MSDLESSQKIKSDELDKGLKKDTLAQDLTLEKIVKEEKNEKLSVSDLSVLLDEKEKEREKSVLEMSNPRVFGGRTIKWDGLLGFLQERWSRWVWSSYGEEVNRAIAEEKIRQEKQERRAKRQQQKEQEGQNQAALPQEPKDPKDL